MGEDTRKCLDKIFFKGILYKVRSFVWKEHIRMFSN